LAAFKKRRTFAMVTTDLEDVSSNAIPPLHLIDPRE